MRVDEGLWQRMERVDAPDPQLAMINVDDARAQGLRSFDRAVLAQPVMHLWAANVPTDLAAGEHRVEVRARSRFEGEMTAATSYRLIDWTD